MTKNFESNSEITLVPFAMYDAQRHEYEERLEKQRLEMYSQIEKEKTDKHKSIKGWKQAFFSILIVAVITTGSLLYLFYNFDFINYDVNGDGVNNINTGTQGDLNLEKGE